MGKVRNSQRKDFYTMPTSMDTWTHRDLACHEGPKPTCVLQLFWSQYRDWTGGLKKEAEILIGGHHYEPGEKLGELDLKQWIWKCRRKRDF